MKYAQERRREKRIKFSWPLWFGYEQNGELHQGKIADLSRSGVSFTVDADQSPAPGSHVLTRFSYPCDTEEHFEIESNFHWSEVIRTDVVGDDKVRVALRLHEMLDQQPCQKAAPEYLMQSV